ncbi:MAG TPA: biotin carboxylase N-terminal domain-containing protein [Vicinamibacterales bacterium]
MRQGSAAEPKGADKNTIPGFTLQSDQAPFPPFHGAAFPFCILSSVFCILSLLLQRLLIANRGEIAIRIIRACRELGVESVAVYSEADAGAAHVNAADRAVLLGPAPAAQSYLSIPDILRAVKESGADAVHPGYGFLSENAAFAAACEAARVVFVGPPSDVIASMGSKIEARRVMQAAGVPVVPGEIPDDQSDAGLVRSVERVGLPVLIKASAGGGGKGMRRVTRRDELQEAVSSARREAAAAFDDGTLYVERWFDRPRHIEVQVLADAHGRIVHLFERECSIQRRYQKVIEESPSIALTPQLRNELTQAAVTAARSVRYRNAGTIEFLLDTQGGNGEARFYFLEMNTRLQVEHPVTELVTGVDLVRAQILVASGEPIPWNADSLGLRGHAIEARVYAEDPARGFLPQAGRIWLYREPSGPGIRIDSGVQEGSEVTVHYDPLLAKVIAVGESRGVAAVRLMDALRRFPILGVRTNIPFLLRVLSHPRFETGQIDTGFLDAEDAMLTASEPESLPDVVRAALAAHAHEAGSPRQNSPSAVDSRDPWKRLKGWRA